jgi:hypothetical protein
MQVCSISIKQEELYDLHNDPYEINNLALNEAYQDILKRHSDALDEWIIVSGDFIPSVRTPDDFDRITAERLPPRKRPRPMKKDMFGSGKY